MNDSTYRAARFNALRGMINRSADPERVAARVSADYELTEAQTTRLRTVLWAVLTVINNDEDAKQ